MDNPHQGDIAALCAVNTFLSSAAGCVAALLLKLLLKHRETGEFSFDLVAAMNGTLTGLVAVSYFVLLGTQLSQFWLNWLYIYICQITAGCATLEPWTAIITGLIAGCLYLFASDILIKMKIDDAVDAVPVHCIGGAWGLLAVGLFSHPDLTLNAYGNGAHPGFFYSIAEGHNDARLLACQVVGILFIFGWTLVRCF